MQNLYPEKWLYLTGHCYVRSDFVAVVVCLLLLFFIIIITIYCYYLSYYNFYF